MFSVEDKNRVLELKSDINKNVEHWFEGLKTNPHNLGADWQTVVNDADLLRSWLITYCSVSGGGTASVWHGDSIKDIDWFYNGTDFGAFKTAIDNMFVAPEGKFHKFVKDIDPKYLSAEVKGKVITANAITLINNMQIIRLDTVEKSRKKFDFIHCQPVLNLQTNEFRMSFAQYESIKYKRLVANPHGLITHHRVYKFKDRGWDTSGIDGKRVEII